MTACPTCSQYEKHVKWWLYVDGVHVHKSIYVFISAKCLFWLDNILKIQLGFTLQFSQQSYGYSLSQPQTQIGQASLTQPNVFLPTTLSQHDLYQTSQLTGYQPRNQPYGQTAGQQNTVMVSSATTSLMSTAVKPPTQDYG